jgi:hypothetical protein
LWDEQSVETIFYPNELRDHGEIQYGVQDGRHIIKSTITCQILELKVLGRQGMC